MKTSVVVRKTGKRIVLRVMSLLMLLSILSGTCSAAWPPYQPDPSWNIVRDATLLDLPPAMMDVGAGTGEVISCQFIEDQYLNQSIAYSCSGNSSYGSYQHVYAYNTADGSANYSVDNSTGHTQTFTYTPENTGLPDGYPVLINDKIKLSGKLIAAKTPAPENPYYNGSIAHQVGLMASFDIQAIYELEYSTGTGTNTIDIPIMLGGVDLFGWYWGRTIIRPRGWINWTHITAVENEHERIEQEILEIGGREYVMPLNPYSVYQIETGGDLFQIELSDLELPLLFYSRVGTVNNVKIQITSEVAVSNSSSGAEVNFMPGDASVLPAFHESNQIPEPSTLILMLTGGLYWRSYRKFTQKT
ncbi:MAG: PEP-CTERM sorting domain-containing protein [Sedimentisphaerales bacterium]|nr:PEP-CTERM sorting domain-containing protein [Sedimentisphaerales bacterium]